MGVEILGPVQVRQQDKVDVPTPRLARLLLGNLALRANQTVTREAVVRILWNDRPPASAAANLRGYVGQLRRMMPPGASLVEICVDRVGYRLRAEPSAVDATWFVARAASARALFRSGAYELAAAEFGSALQLWRGSVFDGDPVPDELHAEVNALEMRRMDVLEDWMEARLAAGEHQAVCPELAVLADASPLREKLYAQLMLALYRCGRQGEALAAYQRVRLRLRDELGVDPSPQVRQVHQCILRGDAPSAIRAS